MLISTFTRYGGAHFLGFQNGNYLIDVRMHKIILVGKVLYNIIAQLSYYSGLGGSENGSYTGE